MILPSLLGAVALSVPLLQGSPREPDGRRSTDVSLAVARLLDGDATAEQHDSDALGAELRDLGPSALPALLDVLARGRAPGVEPGLPAGRRLSSGTIEVVRETLLAAAPGDLRNVLRALNCEGADEGADEGYWVAALALAGEFATDRDVGLLLDLARCGSEERTVRSSLRDALARVYARDPRSVRSLPSMYRDAPQELLVPLLQATRAVEPTRAVEELARLLGAIPAADTLVLAEIGRRAPRVRKPADDAVTGRIRGYLQGADSNRVGTAIQVLGALGDGDSAREILRCLEDSNSLRHTCAEALRDLTGQRLGDDPRAWRALLDAEETWWRNESRRVLGALAKKAPADAVESLLEGSRHLLYRHEIASQLTAVLQRPEVDLVVLGCSALGHLGSRAGLEALIDQLDHPVQEVRGAARRALVEICGADHGEAAAAWRESEL